MRLVRGLVGLALLAVGVGLGVYAERSVVDSASVELVEPPLATPTVVTPRLYEFGRAVRVAVRVQRERPLASSVLLNGIVTSTSPLPLRLAGVTRIARIDERPIFAVAGTVPAYRDLTVGARGRDVEQLQEGLVSAGHLQADAVDGRFGTATAHALRALYEDNDSTYDNVLPAGSLVFVPDRAEIREGQFVVGAPAPASLELELPFDGEANITTLVGNLPTVRRGLVVTLDGSSAVLEVASVSESGADLELVLVPVDCAPGCLASFEPTGDSDTVIVAAQLELIPRITALSIPVSAVRVGEDGQAFLTKVNGERVEIDVAITQDGLAQIEGSVEPSAEFLAVPGDR